VKTQLKDDIQIPLVQRRPPPPTLEVIERQAADRNSAIIAVYSTAVILASNLLIIWEHFLQHRCFVHGVTEFLDACAETGGAHAATMRWRR